ncbi:MAG TPA: flagellin, partial [Rhodanobacter sp.]|nr:flagellin [Rhodanobacter sp.]
MVMSVITNISSLNAQKNLATSQSKLATAISRLSSGMRINSAKDDAAGLAISTRFTTQINGLNQAVSNANDGISLAQTPESALNEVTNNMQRIRTLAVQSANATNSDSDRSALDAEVQQRLSEITRISQQTTFNGRHVLDGTFGNAAFQIGANVGETISVNLSQGAGAKQVGQVATSATGDISSQFASPAGLTLAAGDLTVSVGGATAVNVAAASYTDAASLIAAINTAAGSTIAA